MFTNDDLAAILKAELHCHLEGSLHLETLWELSQRNQRGRFTSLEELKAAVTIPKGVAPGFKPFLGKFDALRFCYGTLKDLWKLIYKSTWELTNLDACAYREVRFSPVFFARRTLRNPDPDYIVPRSLIEETAAAVIEAADNGFHAPGLTEYSFILTCDRTFGVAVNKPALDLLHTPIAKQIAGLDLAGDESVDASDFVEPFREWKSAGKMITIHAGEDPNANASRNISEALDLFKADRIGHGVRAIENPVLMARLAEESIPLEICPTSNVQTGAVVSAPAHPMKRLFDAGIPITINTDDPIICGTDLEAEYEFAARLGFSINDLKQCTRNTIMYGTLPDTKKQAWLSSLK